MSDYWTGFCCGALALLAGALLVVPRMTRGARRAAEAKLAEEQARWNSLAAKWSEDGQ